jgi:hypothetical protein
MSSNLTAVNPIESHPPHPAPNVVDKVATFVKRFVFLKEPSLYRLLALWIIHTYLIEEFEYTGYVFAYSPEPESGKTRLLDVMHVLVHNSSGILASPTEAVLFRTAKDHTQLLDEADTWMNMQSIKGVLNAGSKHGGIVSRMDKLPSSGYKAADHQVFAPRAIAGIGVHILAPATRSRTFEIEMIRQRKEERRERFRAREVASAATQLVATIKEWVERNKSRIALRCWEPFPYLDRFGDRTVDICGKLRSGRTGGPMFRDTTGGPLNLDNLARRVIQPVLVVNKLRWHGWHAFRRGLATNLHRLGVDDKTIQTILRHSSVQTTREIYIKGVSSDATAAMGRLEVAIQNQSAKPN